MHWALRTLWACSTGFHAYPALLAATARQLWHYLATFTLLSTLVLSVAVSATLWRRMDDLIRWAQQLPTITIVEGTAVVDAAQPLRLTRRDVAGIGDLAIVVDTTGETATLEEPAAFSVVLTAHALRIQQGRATRTYQLQHVRRLVIDDAFIARWGRALAWWVCALTPVVLFGYGVAAATLQALLWSGCGWWILRLREQPLAFAAVWRLALFAEGPPRVFAAVVEAFTMGHSQPILWMVYLALYVVFFSGALAAVQRHGPAPGKSL